MVSLIYTAFLTGSINTFLLLFQPVADGDNQRVEVFNASTCKSLRSLTKLKSSGTINFIYPYLIRGGDADTVVLFASMDTDHRVHIICDSLTTSVVGTETVSSSEASEEKVDEEKVDQSKVQKKRAKGLLSFKTASKAIIAAKKLSAGVQSSEQPAALSLYSESL